MVEENQVPTVRRVSRITGKTIVLRDVLPSDADFIFSVRTDPKKSAYISSVSGDVADQVRWIEQYRTGEGQAYFIIENKEGHALGTVRLYAARGNSFCWGSWILANGAPPSASIESALIVYRFALDTLGFTGAYFQVSRENTSVWAFHERFGARRAGETNVEFEYTIDQAEIRQSFARYKKFVSAELDVQEY